MTRLYGQFQPRIKLVNSLFTLMIGAVVLKLFVIQVLDHDRYSYQAARQSSEIAKIPGIRGHIFDRNGELLTSNIIRYSFAADPRVLTEPDSLAKIFSSIFSRPANHYQKLMSSDKAFVWLERNISRDRAAQLLDLDLPGFIKKKEVRRFYPYTHVAAQVIGFTDVDNHGISGMEKYFESQLQGITEELTLRRNARGELLPQRGDEYHSARNGHSLHLTIDIDFQSIFEEEMARDAERLSAKSIQGVLINPQTGEILAMAQYPGFDPNSPGVGAQSNQRMLPLTDLYEPGSTLKVVTVTAALEEGLFSPSDEIFCENGEFDYHGLQIQDTRSSGMLTVSEIIAFSSNIGIIKIAEKLGPDLQYKYARRFGLGIRPKVLPSGETPGLLQSPAKWSAVSPGEIAMGQEVGVSTIQLAMIFSAIANGGNLLRPHLVSEIRAADGTIIERTQPEVIRRVASPATMAQLRKMLKFTVEAGTGITARIPGYTLAGKTGTAQKFIDGAYSQTEFVATFAAMFPAENPRLVCVVAVDTPEYGMHFGSLAAAPIVRDTFRRLLHLDDDYLIPDKVPARLAAAPARHHGPLMLATSARVPQPAKLGVVPDFRGYSMRQALKMARQAGIRIRLNGSGVVVRQSIGAGIRLGHDTVCILSLAAKT